MMWEDLTTVTSPGPESGSVSTNTVMSTNRLDGRGMFLLCVAVNGFVNEEKTVP